MAVLRVVRLGQLVRRALVVVGAAVAGAAADAVVHSRCRSASRQRRSRKQLSPDVKRRRHSRRARRLSLSSQLLADALPPRIRQTVRWLDSAVSWAAWADLH